MEISQLVSNKEMHLLFFFFFKFQYIQPNGFCNLIVYHHGGLDCRYECQAYKKYDVETDVTVESSNTQVP